MSETRQRGGAPIEFWFDFASGYAYFGALEIEALAERHGRTVGGGLLRAAPALYQSAVTSSSAPGPAKCTLYNLASPNGIVEPCQLSDLSGWLARELKLVPENEKSVLERVADQIDSFVRWPREAVLLWPDCDRIAPPSKKHRYHSYPAHIRQLAKTAGVVLDTRPNGPAIASFRLAGG